MKPFLPLLEPSRLHRRFTKPSGLPVVVYAAYLSTNNISIIVNIGQIRSAVNDDENLKTSQVNLW